MRRHLIQFKIYRRIRVLLGNRSFILKKDGDIDTHILIYGTWGRIPEDLIAAGYVEEWPKHG